MYIACAQALLKHQHLTRLEPTLRVTPYRHVKSGPFAGVPIAGSLGDQMSAMLGQRCKVSRYRDAYGLPAQCRSRLT